MIDGDGAVAAKGAPDDSPVASEPEADEFLDFPSCGRHLAIDKNNLEWMHGEVYFEETKLNSKYLIVPQGIDNARDILAVMCSLWGLQMPEHFLALNGGQDTTAGMLSNCLDQDVWLKKRSGQNTGQAVAEREKKHAVTSFNDAMINVSRGMATACSEANTWAYGFDGSYGGADGDEMWGNCLNTAWSYFGQGRRTSPVAGNVNFICARALRGMYGERKFRRQAVLLSEKAATAVNYPAVSHRFHHQGRTVPNCVAAEDAQTARPRRDQMIWPEFTHILLFDGDSSKYPFPDMYDALKSLSATVHIIFGGVHPTLTNMVLEDSDHVNFVVVKNSGGAADVIAKTLETRQAWLARSGANSSIQLNYKQSADDLLEKRDEWKQFMWSTIHPAPVRWSLPQNVKESNFCIVDAKQESVVSVVDKILCVLSHADDIETRQLGAASSESELLKDAWKSMVCYKYNASFFGRSSSFYTYTIVLLALLTTASATLKVYLSNVCEAAPHHGSETLGIGGYRLEWSVSDWELQIIAAVLPLLSCFILSCNARFSPFQKWVQLTNAANLIRTEIYRYRMRVGEYEQIRGATLDVKMRIRRMPKVRSALESRKTSRMASRSHSRQHSGTNTPTTSDSHSIIDNSVRIDFSKLSKLPLLRDGGEQDRDMMGEEEVREDGNSLKVTSMRRKHFKARMESINTESANGDARLTSLYDPPRSAVRKERLGLVSTRHQTGVDNAAFDEDFHPSNSQTKMCGTRTDDGLSALTADDYVCFRTYPAMATLRGISRSHEFAIFFLEMSRLIATMLIVMVAVLGKTITIPVVVALIASITHVLDFNQFAARLQAVNAALGDLQNLIIWWDSLDMVEKRKQPVKEHLLEVTEGSVHADFLWARSIIQAPIKNDAAPGRPKKIGRRVPRSVSQDTNFLDD